jgi:hypothetical protein
MQEFLDEQQVARVGESLVDGWHWRVGLQNAKMKPDQIAVIVEEATLGQPDDLSALGLSSPTRAQRIRAVLLDPQAVREEIRKRGGVLPDGTLVVLDIASTDAFDELLYMNDPARLAFWIGRLPVRRAAFGRYANTLLELFREPSPDELIHIGREFRPPKFEIRANRIRMVCCSAD